MATRSSKNWEEMPGSFDTVGITLDFYDDASGFYADNAYGIPLVRKSQFALDNPPKMLLGYNVARGLDHEAPALSDTAVHFFIDDYRFEVLWNRPQKTLAPFQRFHISFTPDWSLYIDYPLAVQIWNTYRNRWCGAWWQKNGVQGVVPSIGWSDERSYDFAFSGVEQGSAVAISTIGIRDKEFWVAGNWERFKQGYLEMLRRIKPAMVYCYGPIPDWALDLTPVMAYPTTWDLKKPTKRMHTVGKDLYVMPPEEFRPKIVPHKRARKPEEREAIRSARKAAKAAELIESGPIYKTKPARNDGPTGFNEFKVGFNPFDDGGAADENEGVAIPSLVIPTKPAKAKRLEVKAPSLFDFD
jgi:hypothetical protein